MDSAAYSPHAGIEVAQFLAAQPIRLAGGLSLLVMETTDLTLRNASERD
jgi:hypothetical protein